MTENKIGHIYTVSKLTRQIKSLLEETFPFVWVMGEISNLAVPVSGHSYFTLKDQRAVISCVMFKNQQRNLKFRPENGLKIFGMARLAVYEPRGSYQLIFEHMEPEGAGSMQIAFEQLKRKLSDKGFFDERHKKPIPFLPSKISVITSGTGAAVKDIITVAQRRFPGCPLQIVPVNVQGDEAPKDIVEAITLVNQLGQSELIILARGGGSLEDLLAFNSEIVAVAIFESDIPIITGVGHETDVTIADFVADLRAPTPSAAAELALPDQRSLTQQVLKLQEILNSSLNKKIYDLKKTVLDLISRLKSPGAIVDDFRFRLEDYEDRLFKMMKNYIQHNREKLNWLSASLYSKQPVNMILDNRQRVKSLSNTLTQHFYTGFQRNRTNHLELDAKLRALNPHAVLKRGYSIARFVSDKKVITDSGDVNNKDHIEVILAKGRLITRVEKIHD